MLGLGYLGFIQGRAFRGLKLQASRPEALDVKFRGNFSVVDHRLGGENRVGKHQSGFFVLGNRIRASAIESTFLLLGGCFCEGAYVFHTRLHP